MKVNAFQVKWFIRLILIRESNWVNIYEDTCIQAKTTTVDINVLI
jgi:hypothetical protein